MKRAALKRNVCSVSLTIRQALALTRLEGGNGAFPIIKAERDAVIKAEVKFGQIAM